MKHSNKKILKKKKKEKKKQRNRDSNFELYKSDAGMQSITLQELILYTASAPNLSRAPHSQQSVYEWRGNAATSCCSSGKVGLSFVTVFG